MRAVVQQNLDENDRHAGPGWLAASGIACQLGQHWPAAALSAGWAGHRHSECADCGRAMARAADGRWRISRHAAGTGARTAVAS